MYADSRWPRILPGQVFVGKDGKVLFSLSSPGDTRGRVLASTVAPREPRDWFVRQRAAQRRAEILAAKTFARRVWLYARDTGVSLDVARDLLAA